MVSIRHLVVMVLVVALNCSLLRVLLSEHGFLPFDGWPPWFRRAFVGSLPMTTLIGVGGFFFLTRRQLPRPFLAGFVVSGLIAWMGLLGVSLVLPKGWYGPLHRYASDHWRTFYALQKSTVGLSHKLYLQAAEMLLFVCLFSIPEFLLAIMGGRLLARRLCLRFPESTSETSTTALSLNRVADPHPSRST